MNHVVIVIEIFHVTICKDHYKRQYIPTKT